MHGGSDLRWFKDHRRWAPAMIGMYQTRITMLYLIRKHRFDDLRVHAIQRTQHAHAFMCRALDGALQWVSLGFTGAQTRVGAQTQSAPTRRRAIWHAINAYCPLLYCISHPGQNCVQRHRIDEYRSVCSGSRIVTHGGFRIVIVELILCTYHMTKYLLSARLC